MKHSLLLIAIVLVSACGGVKQAQKTLNTGNYDQFISKAVSKLRKSKTKKSSLEYIPLLEQAFTKAVARDSRDMAAWEKENNGAYLEKSYNKLLQLKKRQELIRPLLPLNKQGGQRAAFNFEDYSSKIVATKRKLTDYLYNSSVTLMNSARSKQDYRKAYDDFAYIQKINANHKDVAQRMDDALFKGTDFVLMKLQNKSNTIMPKRLEEDLLNFDTYGLNKNWTVYHGTKDYKINYDYEMEVAFRQIQISPEKISERQLEREKTINDGWEYLKDEDGKITTNAEGEKIKVDVTKKVRCEYYEFRQFKSANVSGLIRYKSLRNNQVLESFPLQSQFTFEHIYANHSGDKRALDTDLVRFLGLQSVPFPSNEQMVYDCGEDIKIKLKGIISRYNFN